MMSLDMVYEKLACRRMVENDARDIEITNNNRLQKVSLLKKDWELMGTFLREGRLRNM